MINEDSETRLITALDTYEKARRRDAWTLAAIAWLAWVAVWVPGLASDMTSGAFLGISIAALARALQVQLKRSPEDRFLGNLRDLIAQEDRESR